MTPAQHRPAQFLPQESYITLLWLSLKRSQLHPSPRTSTSGTATAFPSFPLAYHAMPKPWPHVLPHQQREQGAKQTPRDDLSENHTSCSQEGAALEQMAFSNPALSPRACSASNRRRERKALTLISQSLFWELSNQTLETRASSLHGTDPLPRLAFVS